MSPGQEADDALARCLEQEVLPIVRYLERSSLAEVTIETADVSITVRREPGAPPEEAEPEPVERYVRSAWVGRLGWAAHPGPRPGDQVAVGQVVAHVEALGLRHEVEAEVGGQVAAVLAGEGEVVEYGQPLLELVP